MTLALNTSVAVLVTAYEYGPERDHEGFTYREVLGVLPGVRLDVQRECIQVHPGLAPFVIEPTTPVHDCGPNGVRLFAQTEEELLAAAPTTGSPWDIWLDNWPLAQEEPALSEV